MLSPQGAMGASKSNERFFRGSGNAYVWRSLTY